MTDNNTRSGKFLADQDDSDIPVLVEPPTGVDISSASEMSALFSEESITQAMTKVAVLETFIATATRDCSYNDFVRELLVSIMSSVKCEAGSVFEVDEKNHSLCFRAVVGSSSDQIMNFVIPWGQGIVGHVAESRMSLVVDNAPENHIHLKSIEKTVGFETRNIAAFPIIIRGKVYGVIELLNRVGEPNFTSSDQELLSYFCEMAAKVIELRLMISWVKQTGNSQNEPQGQAA